MIRFILVMLLVLVVLAAYNPQAREILSQFWAEIQPALVTFTDNLYAVVRSLLTANDGHNQTHDPGLPGGNFDRTVAIGHVPAL